MLCSSGVTTRVHAPDHRQPPRDRVRGWSGPAPGTSGRSRAMRSAVRAALGEGGDAGGADRVRDLPRGGGDGAGRERSGSGRVASMPCRQSGSRSTRSTMRSIMLTASYGYCPAAVSALSITASAPSNTAVATSDASARVGAGAVIMLSSICVATTTGMPRWRAARTMRFCASGTSSGGSSTPRSPRATITASDSARIASRLSSACGFSILVMIQARPAAIAFASATSSGRCTKLRPMKSTPCSQREVEVDRGPSRSAPGSAAPRPAR